VAERVCSGLDKIGATVLIQQLLNTRSREVIVFIWACASETQRHVFDLALQGDGNIVLLHRRFQMGPFYIRNAANHVSQTCFYALVHFCTWLSHMRKAQGKLEWPQAWRYAVCSCPVEAHLLEAYLAWHPDVLTSNTKACIGLAHSGTCMRLFVIHAGNHQVMSDTIGLSRLNMSVCLCVASHHLILRRVSIADDQINRGASGSTAENMEEAPARE
jgi:hypothetical protein